MADTWGTRKRAEAEAMGWADEPIGGERKKRDPIDDASGGDRLKRDEAIGHVETQRGTRAYLGHFANDEVLREGHNVGAKPLGKAHGVSEGMAKKGYRKIEGTASKLVGSASYNGRHSGDEVDRAGHEAAAVGLKEPKFVTKRKEKLAADWQAKVADMAFPAMAVKAPKRSGKRSR